MPRTKPVRRQKPNNEIIESRIKDFKRLVNLKIQKFDVDSKAFLEQLEVKVQMGLNQFPEAVRTMTLEQLFTPDPPKKENIPPAKSPSNLNASFNKKKKRNTKMQRPSTATAISDDGYYTESSATRASRQVSRKRERESRSQSQTSSKRMRNSSKNRQSKLANVTVGKKLKENNQSTPSKKSNNSFVITPKVKPNSVCHVLRKPRDGEMVFSTQGSPLMVFSQVSEDRRANVQVPLRNGNVVNLLPVDISLSETLNLDEDTKEQLRILHKHIGKVAAKKHK